MKKQRIIAVIVLLLLIGMVPPLEYLHDKLYKTHLLDYRNLGIIFVIDRHNIANSIMIRMSEEEESSRYEVPDSNNNKIFPGQGVGSIRLGDSIEDVERMWGGSLRKHEYENMAAIWDSDRNMVMEFQYGELERIIIRSKDFLTEEGLRVGSKEEEIRAAYGHPESKSRTTVYYSSILLSLAYSILNIWILALVLSLISMYIFKKRFQRSYLILIIASSFTAIIIYSNPLKIFMYGLEAYVMGLKPMLLWTPVALIAPLVLVGILWGEIISKRNFLTGFKKYAFIICFATLGRIVAFIIFGLYTMLIMKMYYFNWSYLWSVYLIEGLLIYFAWLQFNRLFGIKRDYLMIE